ncbi:MAG: hypothetical protein K0R38_2446 [Polyangiaceae bacterium]|nr:hypothetical protein [Polyangiaceae bacterium]
MRIERWFKVLVLGGAALGKGCAGAGEQGSTKNRSPLAGAAAVDPETGGSNAGAGSASGGTVGAPSASGGHSATSGGGAGGKPIQSEAGQAGAPSSGGSTGGGGGSAGGSSPSGGSPEAGAAGTSGAGGQLVCHVGKNGVGRASDPCGCPCCWARDCSNTEECCGSFCKAGDEGRGCCAP